MKDILTAPFMVEMIRTVTEMYRHGWDERNGGNVSLLLDKSEADAYLEENGVIRTIPAGFSCPELAGRYFLVTGTGKYFKNVQYAPDVNLGLVRLDDTGENAELLWGFWMTPEKMQSFCGASRMAANSLLNFPHI